MTTNETSNRVLSRRATLRLMGAAGATAFVGWQGGWSAIFRMGGNAGTVGAQGPSCVAKPELTEGPYFIDGAINGVATRFLVDTGATSVVIPAALAQQLGFYNGPEVTSRTANGTTVGYRFTARALAFGPFAVDEATIVALPNVHVPLLGMSVLQSVDLQQTQRGLELRPRR